MTRFGWARAHAQLARVFTQRCFYLFVVLLAVLVATPWYDRSSSASLMLTLVDALVLLAAVAAVGRTTAAFVLAVTMAVAVMLLHLGWTHTREGALLALYLWFLLLFCTATVVYLLSYVLRRDVMTMDKLYGAAAAYLLLAFTWALGYALTQHYHPGSFALAGSPVAALSGGDLVYFSMTVLTSTGFGDIVPLQQPAKTLVILEQVAGTLYVAILIARLTGAYPPARRADDA